MVGVSNLDVIIQAYLGIYDHKYKADLRSSKNNLYYLGLKVNNQLNYSQNWYLKSHSLI